MSTYGPYYPTTTASVGAGHAWNNTNNTCAEDNIYADSGPFTTTNYTTKLRLLGFNIGPIGADEIVTGIALTVKRKANTALSISDSTIILVDNGVEIGSNKANPGYWATSNEQIVYGGDGDLWGNSSLSKSQVEGATFGVDIVAIAIGFGPYDPYIDYGVLTVYTSTSGVPVAVSGSIPFTITGYIPHNSSIPLYLCNNPAALISGNIPLYIRGVTPGIGENFDVFPLSIEGSLSQSSGLPLYITNNPTSESVVTLYTKGISSSTNNLPFFVQNVPQSGGQSYLNLFTRGKGTDGLTGEEPDDGLPSGVSATNNSFTLYLNTADGLTVPGGGVGMNMFLNASLVDDTASNMNMFIGGNIWYPGAANNLPLFLYNSIEPLHNSVNLYTKGLGGVDSEGYTPQVGGMNMFIQRNTPAKIDFYIQGPGTVFTQGMNLSLLGGLTRSSGISLVIPQTKGVPVSNLRLYTHGY